MFELKTRRKIAKIRRQIAAGTYETEEKIVVTVDRVGLVLREKQRSEYDDRDAGSKEARRKRQNQ